MSEVKEQIINIIETVQNIVDLFYQQDDESAFEKFEKVVEDIAKMIDNLFLYKETHMDFSFDEKKVCDILKEATEALDCGDNVLMADILQYDFIEYINDLLNDME